MVFLARIYNRPLLWIKIIKNVRGVNLKMQLGIILSAVIDILYNIVNPSLAIVPIIYVTGIIYCKKYDAYFYVRAFSDDLYNVMPEREADVNELILNCLKEGDIFIDLGANIGYYSILAGKIVGNGGQVIAIEPVPTTVKVLNYNIKINNLKNIKVIQKAAWSNEQTINIYTPKFLFGQTSIHKSTISADLIIVEGVPLDILSKFQRVDLLKIDAEGSEYEILKGSIETLKRTRYVILETSIKKEDIVSLLKDEGFKILKLKFTTYILAYKNNSHKHFN